MKNKISMLRVEFEKAIYGIIGFIILFLVAGIMLAENVSTYSNSVLYGYNGSIFMQGLTKTVSDTVLFICIVMVVMVVVQFADQNDYRIGEFVAFLPYSKINIIIMRIISGIISFTVPFIFFVIETICVRNNYIDIIKDRSMTSIYYEAVIANESIKNMLMVLLNMWLFMVAIYVFLVLIQELVNHFLVAGIVSVIILGLPYYLLAAYDKASIIFANTKTYYGEKFINGDIASLLCGVRGFKVFELNDNYGWDYVKNTKLIKNSIYTTTFLVSSSDFFYQAMLILPIISAIILVLIFILVKKRDFTVMGTLFIHKSLQWVFIGVIFIAGSAMPLFWGGDNPMRTLILMLMMGICISLCTRMIVEMFENRR